MDSFWAEYTKYLKSPTWKMVRSRLMAVHGHKCWCCRRTHGIMNVHHLTYARWRNPLVGDVRVLCQDCHRDVTALQRARGKGTDPVIILGMHRAKCKRRNT